MNIKKFDPNWWQEACNDISKSDPVMKKLIAKYYFSQRQTKLYQKSLKQNRKDNILEKKFLEI